MRKQNGSNHRNQVKFTTGFFAGLAVCIMLTLAGWETSAPAASAADIVAQGNCGKPSSIGKDVDIRDDNVGTYASDNLKYILDSEGTLTISGKGEMASCFDSYWQQPWDGYQDKITKLVLEEGVYTVGKHMFEKCSNLQEIQWSSAIAEIGRYAFRQCTSLEELHLPKRLRICGEGAFQGCTNMKEVELPKGEGKWEDYVFKNCESLQQVKFPKAKSRWGFQCFAGCTGLEEIEFPAKVKIKFDMESFADCTSLKKLTFPANIKAEFGEWCFARCTGLEEIEFPTKMSASWGGGCFSRCTSLKRVEIPASDAWWDDEMFDGCTGLEEAVLSQGITFSLPKMGKEWYGGNIIGIYRWKGSGEAMFKDCTALKKIVMPKKMKVVPAGFLMGCTSLKGWEIPEEVEYLGWYPYDKKESTVTLPKSVKILGGNCFYGQKHVEKVIFPSGLQVMDYMALAASGVKEVNIPDNLKIWDGGTFFHCKKLKKVTMGKNVKVLGTHAFREMFDGCSKLVSVQMPSGLKNIGYDAFRGCKSLKKLELPSGITNIDYDAFQGIKGMLIRVPKGKLEKYKKLMKKSGRNPDKFRWEVF